MWDWKASRRIGNVTGSPGGKIINQEQKYVLTFLLCIIVSYNESHRMATIITESLLITIPFLTKPGPPFFKKNFNFTISFPKRCAEFFTWLKIASICQRSSVNLFKYRGPETKKRYHWVCQGLRNRRWTSISKINSELIIESSLLQQWITILHQWQILPNEVG